jgi:hypothetical protein
MFLTESQKKYLKTIKNMSKAQPQKSIHRSEVYLCLIKKFYSS